MPVTFSIKNVPDELAEALRERARRNHRSLQGELMAVLQASIRADRTPPPAMREHTATYEAETLASGWHPGPAGAAMCGARRSQRS